MCAGAVPAKFPDMHSCRPCDVAGLWTELFGVLLVSAVAFVWLRTACASDCRRAVKALREEHAEQLRAVMAEHEATMRNLLLRIAGPEHMVASAGLDSPLCRTSLTTSLPPTHASPPGALASQILQSLSGPAVASDCPERGAGTSLSLGKQAVCALCSSFGRWRPRGAAVMAPRTATISRTPRHRTSRTARTSLPSTSSRASPPGALPLASETIRRKASRTPSSGSIFAAQAVAHRLAEQASRPSRVDRPRARSTGTASSARTAETNDRHRAAAAGHRRLAAAGQGAKFTADVFRNVLGNRYKAVYGMSPPRLKRAQGGLPDFE